MKLLLDAHVAAAVANGLARRGAGLQVVPLRDWQGGRLLNAAGADLLEAAFNLKTAVGKLANGWKSLV